MVLFSKALNLNWQFCKKTPELLGDPRCQGQLFGNPSRSTHGFLAKEVQLAGCGIAIHLIVPALLILCEDPAGYLGKFARAELLDRPFDLFNATYKHNRIQN